MLGLRGQLIIALSTVFVVSFALLSSTLVRLAQHSDARSSARQQTTITALLKPIVEQSGQQALRATTRELIEAGIVRGGRWHVAGQTSALGVQDGNNPLTVRSDDQWWTLYLETPDGSGHGPLSRLLLFYAALTGFATMLLSFLLVTAMFARPLTAAIGAAETIAAGDLSSRVPLRGAAEMVRLGQALNRMAESLRSDRNRLQSKLVELETLTAQLRESQAQVVHGEKLATVGRISAGIAHEIGNPLSAIVGLIELVRDGDLNEDQQRSFLDKTQFETERIHTIISRLLTYAHKNPTPTELPADGHCDLSLVLDHTIALVRAEPRAKSVSITCTADTSAGTVHGSANLLIQVFLNIVLNAVDAGGGSTQIEIDVRPSCPPEPPHHTVVTICDDGPGIDPGIADRLFEPFATTKPPGKGTGLGLSVCEGLLGQIGGRIAAENRAQGGACFVVTLVTCHPADRTSQGPAEMTTGSPAQDVAIEHAQDPADDAT